jgi:hypothetical protein
MRTAVGCLSWIVGFAILLLLEREWLQRLPALPREAPFDWPLAALLALITALALGSLLGLLSAVMKALRGQGTEPPDPDALRHWQEGQRVEVNGVLEAREAPMAAPFSQRPAVFVSYGAYPRRYGTGIVDERLPPRLDGLQQVPALLRVGHHRIALQGFPAPRGVEEVQFAAEQVGAAAVAHLQRTRWQRAGVPQGGLAGALELFTNLPQGAGATQGRHVMNSRVSATPPPAPGAAIHRNWTSATARRAPSMACRRARWPSFPVVRCRRRWSSRSCWARWRGAPTCCWRKRAVPGSQPGGRRFSRAGCRRRVRSACARFSGSPGIIATATR